MESLKKLRIIYFAPPLIHTTSNWQSLSLPVCRKYPTSENTHNAHNDTLTQNPTGLDFWIICGIFCLSGRFWEEDIQSYCQLNLPERARDFRVFLAFFHLILLV